MHSWTCPLPARPSGHGRLGRGSYSLAGVTPINLHKQLILATFIKTWINVKCFFFQSKEVRFISTMWKVKIINVPNIRIILNKILSLILNFFIKSINKHRTPTKDLTSVWAQEQNLFKLAKVAQACWLKRWLCFIQISKKSLLKMDIIVHVDSMYPAWFHHSVSCELNCIRSTTEM